MPVAAPKKSPQPAAVFAPLINRSIGTKPGAVMVRAIDPAAKGAMIVAQPLGGRMPQDLFFHASAHNIQNRANRPAPVGYTGFNPVVFIQSPAGIGSVARRGAASPAVFRDPHHYAESVIEQPNIAVATAAGGTLLLPESDAKRNLLSVRNNSAAANLYFTFGSVPSINSVLRLTPNQIFLWDETVPQGDMYAIADAVSGFASLQYSILGA